MQPHRSRSFDKLPDEDDCANEYQARQRDRHSLAERTPERCKEGDESMSSYQTSNDSDHGDGQFGHPSSPSATDMPGTKFSSTNSEPASYMSTLPSTFGRTATVQQESSSSTTGRFARLFGMSTGVEGANPISSVSSDGEDQAHPPRPRRRGSCDLSESSTTSMVTAKSTEAETTKAKSESRTSAISECYDESEKSTTNNSIGLQEETTVTKEQVSYKSKNWRQYGFLSQIGSITSLSLFNRGYKKNGESQIPESSSQGEWDSVASTEGSAKENNEEDEDDEEKDAMEYSGKRVDDELPDEISQAVDAMESIQRIVKGTDFKKAVKALHKRCLDKEDECSRLYEQCYKMREERKAANKQLDSLKKKSKRQQATIERLKETLREVRSQEFGQDTCRSIINKINYIDREFHYSGDASENEGRSPHSSSEDRRLAKTSDIAEVMPHENRLASLKDVYQAATKLKDHAKHLLEMNLIHEESKTSMDFEEKSGSIVQSMRGRRSGPRAPFYPRVLGDPVRNTTRGIRILSMDGGGVRGLLILEYLRQLEYNTGKRVHEMFDLIVGTSTGGFLATLLGLKNLSIDEVKEKYERIRAAFGGQNAVWSEVKRFTTGSSHDAQAFSRFLKEIFGEEKMNETVPIPKVCVVSAAVDPYPPEPYLFRNYELSPLVKPHAEMMGTSSCKMADAVQATTCAPTYYTPAVIGGQKFVDGAIVANNPAAIALAEAALIWPDRHLDCLVSMGTGTQTPRTNNINSVMAWVRTVVELGMSSHITHKIASTVLGSKYYRFDAEGLGDVDLTEYREDVLNSMIEKGKKYIDREKDRFDELSRLLNTISIDETDI